MGQRQPIRDLDPGQIEEHDYQEFEALFSAAYEYEFGRTASMRQIWVYVQRYFRFRVIPPWVRHYVKSELRGIGIDNIGNAPLDPAIDLRLVFERLAVLWYLGRGTSGRRSKNSFVA